MERVAGSGSRSWARGYALAWMIARPGMGVACASRLLALVEEVESRERRARGALAGAALAWGLGLAGRALGLDGRSALDMARDALVRAREQEAWERARMEAQRLGCCLPRAGSVRRRRL